MKDILERRFWAKVDITESDKCWIWKAGVHGKSDRNKYGSFWNGIKMEKAHRFSFLLSYGYLPKNKLILHKCDNKLCVNPNHLYAGTCSNNMSDRESRTPVNRESCGITHTKLSKKSILEIRQLKNSMKQCDVASKYGVSRNIIYRIWNKSEFLCKEGYYV